MLSKGYTLPGTPHGVELRRAKRSADEWKTKAEQLEHEQSALRQFLQQAVVYENQLELQVGHLKENRDVVHSQMKMREKGLELRQHREDHFKSDITQLHQRMEEMSLVIRRKEAELNSLRRKNVAQGQEIDMLKSKLDNQGKGLWKVPEHKVEAQAKNMALATKKKVQLPTLVSSKISMYHGNKDTVSNDVGTEKMDGTEISYASVSEVIPSSTSRESYSCIMSEKTISIDGGSLVLPKANLIIPREAIKTTTRVSMSNMVLDKSSPVVLEVKHSGLIQLVKPRLKISLQPSNVKLFEKATLLLHIARDNTAKGKQSRIFVCFMESLNENGDTFVWRAEKSTAMKSISETLNDSIVSIELDRLCGIIVLELIRDNRSSTSITHFSDMDLLPTQTKLAPASGIVAMMAAALNFKSSTCIFVVFAVGGDEETLKVVCVSSSSSQKKALLLKKNDVNVTHFGSGTSRLRLCENEVLSLYFDQDTKYAGALSLDMQKCLGTGQRYRMPFFSCADDDIGDSDDSEALGQLAHPKLLRVKRRIMAPNQVLEDTVCVIHIVSNRRDYMT